MHEVRLRTNTWIDEGTFTLALPDEWQLSVQWPRTPPPLSEREIEEALDRPIGRPPFPELCRGKHNPLIIIDDVNRPTPVSRVLPPILRRLQTAGIPPEKVHILMASGSHGAPSTQAVRNKVGEETADRCTVLVHDAERNLTPLGRTSRGTPILVNSAVAASDLLLGIGGIYPNQTAGFGGGCKLALGVLGMRSIAGLHYGHCSLGWGTASEGAGFRSELDEIARRIRLDTIFNVHCDAKRQPVRLVWGDPLLYYHDEVAFARRCFQACAPADADVVISNTYPTDLTLTFARKKGFHPLRCCKPSASRVAIASCTEGLGLHGLFPVHRVPRFHLLRTAYWKLAVKGPRQFTRSVLSRVTGKHSPVQNHHHPIWLYRPGGGTPLPLDLAGLRFADEWSQVVESVRAEQGGKQRLRVIVYPCAPMQFF